MKKPDEKIIPIRIEADLNDKIQKAAELTGLSKQDIMRLCMRIGLIDLETAENDVPGVVKKIADAKLASFQSFANRQTVVEEWRERAASYCAHKDAAAEEHERGIDTGAALYNELLEKAKSNLMLAVGAGKIAI